MFIKSVYTFMLAASLSSACAQSSAPPPAPPKVTPDQSAASSTSGASGLSTLAQLSAQGDTNGDVRNAQVKVLTSQLATYQDQLVAMQSYADQLFSTDTAVQQQALKSIATTTLGGAAVGSTVAVGGSILVGAMNGDWTQGLLATVPAAAQSLTKGAAAQDAQKQADASAATTSAQVKAQRDSVLAEIANLQTKIASLDNQLAILNAEKL